MTGLMLLNPLLSCTRLRPGEFGLHYKSGVAWRRHLSRGYQNKFSARGTAMFDVPARERKAHTMIAVLKDCLKEPLEGLSLLNVGGSAGIIDNYLSNYFNSVTGVDIDEKAIEHAKIQFCKDNLTFELGDAMDLHFEAETFDVVISSQVYEHVPDARIMMDEVYRVLKPGGVCYFAAGNRLMWNEPHYNLPLLSVVPRPIAHLYLKISGKGDFYYEKHLGYWGLKDLVRKFLVTDYTLSVIEDPEKYATEYMLAPGSTKAKIAAYVARYMIWLVPGYLWILLKPVRR